jgi:hypothetical protein
MALHLEDQRAEREKIGTARARLAPWQRGIGVAQWILPKGSDTIGLLDIWLKEDSDVNLLDILSGNVTRDDSGEYRPARHTDEREVQRRLIEEGGRSYWVVIGTSLAFELAVLAVACLVFARRDY